jgi:hypothetical protein
MQGADYSLAPIDEKDRQAVGDRDQEPEIGRGRDQTVGLPDVSRLPGGHDARAVHLVHAHDAGGIERRGAIEAHAILGHRRRLVRGSAA